MNLINILNLYGYDIFDGIVIPYGVNREILINTIIDKCGTAEPLYTDKSLLKRKINNFFLKNEHTFKRLYSAYIVEYNQINNYDRTETHNETINSISVNDNKVSPYDVDNYVNDTLNSNDNNVNTERTTHTYGNIGVTTSAQMLDQELQILPKLNIYEIIANSFYNEFCIMIY